MRVYAAMCTVGIEKGTVRAFLNIDPGQPMFLSGLVLHFQLPGAGCR